MQILANALPGFRNLRAPLIAGYMWLLFVWLLVQPNPNVRPANQIAASLWDLGQSVGPIWVALSIGTAAYLAGALSQAFAAVIGWFVAKAINAFPLRAAASLGSLVEVTVTDGEDGSDKAEKELIHRLNHAEDFISEEFKGRLEFLGGGALAIPTKANTPVDEVMGRALRDLDERLKALKLLLQLGFTGRTDYARLGRERFDEWRNLRNELRGAHARATARSSQETNLPATLLVGQQPELFAEVDRLRAEGDLRLAVVPSLLAITVLLTIDSLWWALLAVAAFGLAVQGVHRTNQSRRLILDAIRTNKAESPSAKEFSEWLNSDWRRSLEGLDQRLDMTRNTAS